jgi:hydrogenase nickel incorporation protein HypA/HybF
MHELSIALGIIEIAEEESERRGGEEVSAVHLKLGALSGVVRDALLFAYDIACQGTKLAGSKLLIEDVPVVVYCPRCEAERMPASISELACPVCRAPTPQVVKGRELEIVAMELLERELHSEVE